MSRARNTALETLYYTGRVSFAGRSTGWSTRDRLTGYVAFPFAILFLLGSFGTIFQETDTRMQMLKAVALCLVSAGLLYGVGSLVVQSWHHRRVQRRPVLIDERGLTLCGHGPIPWSCLQLAERKKVRLTYAESNVTRDVIVLTLAGSRMLDQQLTEKQRKALVPDHTTDSLIFLFVPGVKGLNAREFMEVYNAAHDRYAPA